MNGTIKIKGKAYKYAFNQKSRRLYMEAAGLEYWDDFAAEMQRMEPHPEKGMSLPGMMVFAGLVIAGIRAVNPDFDDDFDEDELLEALISNPDSLQQLMQDFTKAGERLSPKAKQTKSGKSGSKNVPSRSGKKSKGAGE